MAKHSDVRALKNLVDQAYLVVSTDPIPRGGIESIRENLDAARRLARLLLVKPEKSAAVELGERGGKKTAERGPEYFSQIASMRKTKAGGRPKKHQDVLTSGATPSSVRSRAAFVIVERIRELSMDTKALAKAIHSSEQYARNLVQGVTIPSDEKVNALMKGLGLDNLRADQLKTWVTQDRRRHDRRFRNGA